MVLIVYGGEQTALPLSRSTSPGIARSANLPLYALRTTMRMLLAIVCSIVFTFGYAALAAKSRRAEMVLIPRSTPAVGADPRFLTFTVVFFMNLFPPRARAELACVFAIFTSQAWNMTFSMYSRSATSRRTWRKPRRASPQRLAALLAARRAVRDAGPDLEHHDVDVRGWFFVVASEAITVGNTHVTLPGIGSYVALGIQKQNLPRSATPFSPCCW